MRLTSSQDLRGNEPGVCKEPGGFLLYPARNRFVSFKYRARIRRSDENSKYRAHEGERKWETYTMKVTKVVSMTKEGSQSRSRSRSRSRSSQRQILELRASFVAERCWLMNWWELSKSCITGRLHAQAGDRKE